MQARVRAHTVVHRVDAANAYVPWYVPTFFFFFAIHDHRLTETPAANDPNFLQLLHFRVRQKKKKIFDQTLWQYRCLPYLYGLRDKPLEKKKRGEIPTSRRTIEQNRTGSTVFRYVVDAGIKHVSYHRSTFMQRSNRLSLSMTCRMLPSIMETSSCGCISAGTCSASTARSATCLLRQTKNDCNIFF